MLYNLFEMLYNLLIKRSCWELEPIAGELMSDRFY